MGFENINLWFAKDKNSETVLAKDINKDNKHNDYICPICNSCVIPKTGEIMTWHFAHRDASKCNSETMVHWWVKNELIKIGDKFKVDIEGIVTEYECKELKIEQQYKTSKGVYKPDITIITTNDETIYFEIANTNKKKIKDYIEVWKELKNVVIEIETKEIIEGKKIDYVYPIYYVGKEYVEYKKELTNIANEEKNKYKFTKEQLKEIDWLINDMCKYNQCQISIDELSDEIQMIKDVKLKALVSNILKNKRCLNILTDYIKHNEDTIRNIYNEYIVSKIKIPKYIYDKIYGKYSFDIKYKYYDFTLPVLLTDKYQYINSINNINFIYNNNTIPNKNIFEYTKLNKNIRYCINPPYTRYYDKKMTYEDLLKAEEEFYKIRDYEELQEDLKKLKSNIKRKRLLKLYKKYKESGYNVNLNWNNYNLIISKNYEDISKDINKNYCYKCKFNITKTEKYFKEKYFDIKKEEFINRLRDLFKETEITASWTGDSTFYVKYNKNKINITYNVNSEEKIIDSIKEFLKEQDGIKLKFTLLKNYFNFKVNNVNYTIDLNNDDDYYKIYYKEKLIYRHWFNEHENIEDFKQTIIKIANENNDNYTKWRQTKKEICKYIHSNVNKNVNKKMLHIIFDKDYITYNYLNYSNSYYNNSYDEFDDMIIEINENANFIYFDNLCSKHIKLLNERYFNLVNRRPKIIHDSIDTISVSIECLNRYNKLYFKDIGEFKICDNYSFKFIEQQASNIIRNYIYRIKGEIYNNDRNSKNI